MADTEPGWYRIMMNEYVKNMAESYDGTSGGGIEAPHYDDGGNPYLDGNDDGIENPNIEIDIKFSPIPPPEPVPIQPEVKEGFDPFRSTKFDPSFWDKVKNVFQQGGFYYFKFYGLDQMKIDISEAKKTCYRCDKIEQFESCLYDYFIQEYYENVNYREDFIFGLSRQKNPHKSPFNVYYDGSCFYRLRDEYFDTLKYYTPDRLLSFCKHMGGSFEYSAQYE